MRQVLDAGYMTRKDKDGFENFTDAQTNKGTCQGLKGVIPSSISSAHKMLVPEMR
jgi:hypothetical protein